LIEKGSADIDLSNEEMMIIDDTKNESNPTITGLK